MATKTQAKATIDSAVTAVKADIDNVLPVNANIVDGRIDFAPTHWTLQLDAGGSLTTATATRDAIHANLTAAGRTFTTRSALGRRSNPVTGLDDVHAVEIRTQLANYLISNF